MSDKPTVRTVDIDTRLAEARAQLAELEARGVEYQPKGYAERAATGQLPEKSPELAAVLDLVRSTGKTAHPSPGRPISDPVECIAVLMGCSPRQLQAEVAEWADAIDAMNARHA